MDALDVGIEVAFSVVRLVAAITRTVEHCLGDGLRGQDTVSHLEVPGQLLVGSEGREAVLASGRVNDQVVLLQVVIGREEIRLERCQVAKRIDREGSRVGGYAHVARVSRRVVVHLLVVTKSLGGVEGLRTLLTGVEVGLFALEWLLVLVDRHDVSLKCILLSERLITVPITSTSVSLSSLVSFHMALQPRTGEEDLVASFPSAFVISLLGVCTLDMVLKVGVSEVVFRAASVRTFEGAHIIVRSEVLFEFDRSIEGFVAIVSGALQSFLATRRLELGC